MSLRSRFTALAGLFATMLVCTLGFDRVFALWLSEHASALVPIARSFTDAITWLVLPWLPKWVHPLVLIVVGGALTVFTGRAWLRPFAITAVVLFATRVSVTWLKGVFERVRPFEYLADPKLADFFVAGHDSFPSGHTAVYMGLLIPPALMFARWRWPLVVIASLLAFARVVEGDHYLGDVIGSAFIALCFTVAGTSLVSRSPSPGLTP